MPHDIDLYKSAQVLRYKGMSFNQIQKELGVSKSTLSYWFAGDSISNDLKLKLSQSSNKINYKHIIHVAHTNREVSKKRHLIYIKEARKEYDILKRHPLFFIGLALYWGEGRKSGKGTVQLVNSDPGLLELTSLFYKNVLKISSNKIRCALFIYPDISEEVALDYWSKKVKIPKEQFIKTQVLKSRTYTAKTKVRYGMCNIYFSSTEMNVKIKEWIRLMYEEMRV